MRPQTVANASTGLDFGYPLLEEASDGDEDGEEVRGRQLGRDQRRSGEEGDRLRVGPVARDPRRSRLCEVVAQGDRQADPREMAEGRRLVVADGDGRLRAGARVAEGEPELRRRLAGVEQQDRRSPR